VKEPPTIHISTTERVHSIAHKAIQVLPVNSHNDFWADIRYTSGRADALSIIKRWVTVVETKSGERRTTSGT